MSERQNSRHAVRTSIPFVLQTKEVLLKEKEKCQKEILRLERTTSPAPLCPRGAYGRDHPPAVQLLNCFRNTKHVDEELHRSIRSGLLN